MPFSRYGSGTHNAIHALFAADTGGGTAPTGGGTNGDAAEQQQAPPASESGGTDESRDLSALPEWVQTLVRDARKDAGDARVLRKKLDEIEAAERQRQTEAQRAEEARLVEQQQYQQLAEKRAKELEALKPLAERTAALEARIKAANEARIGRVPDSLRSVIPADYDPVKLSEWLDANLDKLTKPTAPNIDDGHKSDRTPKPDTKLPSLPW